ncbi:GvpL/GvpF family gas vesicle protein [Ammoniphilus sp. YIM 78166]|uniref:GvpL/GvpF family gas vesicle protein n=1 Tax=Ammoniphilus sp. YIM 78166 TaxID=1644106 RepID=UPI00106FDFC3|nr:GvpL/GvpF family gas vesicle protein [Ammoniphilus sp. YIM 78166]
MSEIPGIYVFCAFQADVPEAFGTAILNGNETPVFSLRYKDIALAVCQVDQEVLPTRENLMAHQKVIAKVMEKHAVVPMSFGNVFHDEKNALYITEHLYEQLRELLPHLENKIEVGLKIVAEEHWLQEEWQKDPTFKKWSGKGTLQSAGAFYDRITMGELAQKFFLSLRSKVETDIYVPLSVLAESSKLNDVLSEKMLLNAAFLIDRNLEKEFDEKVNSLFEEWEGKVVFKYSGPWPAYNFVNIRLKIEGSS